MSHKYVRFPIGTLPILRRRRRRRWWCWLTHQVTTTKRMSVGMTVGCETTTKREKEIQRWWPTREVSTRPIGASLGRRRVTRTWTSLYPSSDRPAIREASSPDCCAVNSDPPAGRGPVHTADGGGDGGGKKRAPTAYGRPGRARIIPDGGGPHSRDMLLPVMRARRPLTNQGCAQRLIY